MAYALALLAALAGVVWVEWHTDEVTVVLAVLLVFAGALGLAWPRRFLVTGAVLGSVLALAHLTANGLGRFQPAYELHPMSLQTALTLFVLFIPATIVAFGGARVRQLARR